MTSTVLFALDFNAPTAFGIPLGALLLVFILFNALNQGKTNRKVYHNYAPARKAQYPWLGANIITSLLLSLSGTFAWALLETFAGDWMKEAETDPSGVIMRMLGGLIISFLGLMLTWRIAVWFFFRPNK